MSAPGKPLWPVIGTQRSLGNVPHQYSSSGAICGMPLVYYAQSSGGALPRKKPLMSQILDLRRSI